MAGYMKIDGVDGESTDAGHEKWINLLSVSQGLSRPMKAGASGSTRQRASTDVGDVVVVKEMDSSTTKLIQALCDGKNYKEILIDLCTSTGKEGRVPYYQWKLEKCFITSYDVSGGATDGSVPTESLSINFERIHWTYDKMDKDGNSTGKIPASWDVEKGTKA